MPGESALNQNRCGWQDERSRQPPHMHKLVRDLRKEHKNLHMHLPIFQLLENVASAQPQVVQQYTELIGGPPVEIDNRLWGVGQ